MKKQFISVVAIALAVLAILTAWAVAAEPPNDVLPRILSSVVVFATGMTVMFLKKRHQARTLEQAEGSFEKEVATQAQSAAYIDTLVILVATLAAVAIFADSAFAALAMLVTLILAISAFWFRYHRAKRNLLAEARS
ncbi:hypothetical protein ART_3024 [Arthrobacter sp. PAMC 25486]|uniref:hypothetical protein n=1 Tax=Arthrobacter sp. PAMC 25486 TaxID=1494608 RepID=UPI0005361560|nr:hypothetical protein [Arthrobacter sp. PAMC 25486]AIY02623.1 hypothetical protein ART_3024 [Arthrobacter sp. PAMC 25486]